MEIKICSAIWVYNLFHFVKFNEEQITETNPEYFRELINTISSNFILLTYMLL